MPLYVERPRPYILGASGVAVATTNTVAHTVQATVNIPGGTIGANGFLRVRALWTHTNSGNAKTLRCILGGIGGTVLMGVGVTTTASTELDRVIHNRNSQSSQVIAPSNNTNSFSSNTVAVLTTTVDTSAALDLVLTCQMAALAETTTLERYLVEVLYRA